MAFNFGVGSGKALADVEMQAGRQEMAALADDENAYAAKYFYEKSQMESKAATVAKYKEEDDARAEQRAVNRDERSVMAEADQYERGAPEREVKNRLDEARIKTEGAKQSSYNRSNAKKNKDEYTSELYTDAKGNPLKERTVKQLTNEWKQSRITQDDYESAVRKIDAKIEDEIKAIDVAGWDYQNKPLVAKEKEEIIQKYAPEKAKLKAQRGSLKDYIDSKIGNDVLDLGL